MTKTTANYLWLMPDPGGSPNTWGTLLNGTTEAIDQQVYKNQQGESPVGSGALWFTQTPPTNWLICDGSSLDTTTYAKLFAVIGYAFGGSGANFNLPSLLNRFPFGGAALGAVGGAAATTLTAAQLPSHTHTATQAAHSHIDQGHTHGATGSQAPHSHGLTGTPMTENVGPNGAPGSGWGFNDIRTDAQQPAVTVAVVAGAANIQPAAPAITVNATPAPTAQVPTMPPYLTINFIIRYQ